LLAVLGSRFVGSGAFQTNFRFMGDNRGMIGTRLHTLAAFLVALFLTAPLLAAVSDAQRSAIDQITGVKGAYTADEDVYRVNFPRTDVKVAVEGRSMHPFLGLTSWAAFTPHSQTELMVMGDLVLFEDEVNPVMSVALDNGLEVTALHNHFFFDSPRVMFMHIGGSGTAERLATAVARAMDKVKEIRKANAQPTAKFAGLAVPETNSITASTIDGILGVKGQVNAGMYKVSLGRKATMHGKSVSNQMGVNTWAAFAGTDEAAFVDGDFAMLESELQPVLKALRKAGINVVAIHNHMTNEEPQYVFLHYWGKGQAASLAKGLRSALDTQRPVAAVRVVFVCEHGAAKSVIAAQYFNKLSSERGLGILAVARGTSPDPQFNPAATEGLQADGFAVPEGKPQSIGAADVADANRVITFDVKLPSHLDPAQHLEWNNTPSPSASYGAYRDAVRTRVEALVSELAR
jgi:protein-tyrosine-phosphatase